MKKRILLIGTGVLAQHVQQSLAERNAIELVCLDEINEDVIQDGVDLAVMMSDGWQPAIFQHAENVFRRVKIPWIRGFVILGCGLIGPLVQPDIQGCSVCADARYLMADRDRREMFQFRFEHEKSADVTRDVWSSLTGLWHVAHVLIHEIHRVLKGDTSNITNHLIQIDLKDLTLSRHFVLPDAKCTMCGQLPEDTPELAIVALEPTPKERPNSYRTRSFHDVSLNLLHDYVDSRTGLLNATVRDLITPFAAISMNLPLWMGDEGTAGRSHTYPESEGTAVLEGLERYCGLEARRSQLLIYDTYEHLKEYALFPPAVGLHAPEQYAKTDFPFQAFDASVPMRWVWGYSLCEKQPLLVPERLAFYSLGIHQEGFVYETSNGCALGGSLVEAIFHGILEVVERDAFLITWYAQLPLPEVDLSSIQDTEIQRMILRLHRVAGYEIRLFNATMENGIPSVFVVAKNRRSSGMNLICAAGSHVDAHRAIRSALHEVAGLLFRFDEKLERDITVYQRMAQDASHVRHMEDHPMVYGLVETECRFDFLLSNQSAKQSFTEAFPAPNRNVDLADDLSALIHVFQRLHLDVIVVNQTSTELEKNGLHCVKVLIPGMLPMTFGHSLRRLEGLERVLRIPMELGYTERPLTRAELNPHPHPFC